MPVEKLSNIFNNLRVMMEYFSSGTCQCRCFIESVPRSTLLAGLGRISFLFYLRKFYSKDQSLHDND